MLEKIQKLLSRHYAPAVQSRLSRLPSRDQLPLASWLVQNPVGTSYALQILEHLESLSKKKELAVSQILARILAPFQQDKLHPKELGKKILEVLHQTLHQQSASYHNLFKEFEQGLRLPEGVFLHSPKNSEDSVFSLDIRFGEVKELKDKIEKLRSSIETRDWKKLEGL